jgi:hypothetical protein
MEDEVPLTHSTALYDELLSFNQPAATMFANTLQEEGTGQDEGDDEIEEEEKEQ